ncbi:MAG: glutamine-hydrolyzing GMP synthase, partial [Microthrixaceae bacterium]|nr:glutamine-hydrolyzing GMP synthase [Microthrixaceae bacterium]
MSTPPSEPNASTSDATAAQAPSEEVLVIDMGAQYAQLIARRVREAKVFSEVVPHTITAAEMAQRAPGAIIISGGPKSVHVEDSPRLDPGIYELGIPILGICYGAQLIASQLGGSVERSGAGEYGRTKLEPINDSESRLLGTGCGSLTVWMSHFDAIADLPDGFVAMASTPNAPVAVLENSERGIYGVQFHPEVVHTDDGQQLLERFLHDIAGLSSSWTMEAFIESAVRDIRAQVSDGRAICGLSG